MNPIQTSSRSIAKQFTRDYLFVSLIPVLVLLVCISIGALMARSFVAQLIQESANALKTDAEKHMELLGQEIIQTKARDVSKQVEIFLKYHTALSIEQLKENPRFHDLALQKVGVTGYTCLYEAGTGIMRIHPNPDLIDRDMSFLADQLPSWWAIFKPTLSGREVSGYYNWLEADGRVRRKYMSMTPVGETLGDKTLMIAATTYIDEFSAPIQAINKKVAQISSHYEDVLSHQGLMIAEVSALVLLVTFAGVYVLGRRSGLRYIRPIEQLAKAANKFGEGQWTADEHVSLLDRGDEIGDLATAFGNMQAQLKELFNRLQERLEDLKRTQEALRESEEHFRNLFDGVPIGVFQTTPEGEILTSNPTLVKMLGYTDLKTLMARNAKDLWADPQERQKWKETIEALSDVHGQEIQMRRMDGSVIWVENHCRTVRDAAGKVRYFEGSLKDVSERKRAEAALKQSEQEFKKLYEEAKRAEEVYRSLINSSADAIVIYDMQGNAEYISPVFTQIFGWTPREVIGRRIPFVPESEAASTMKIIRDLVETGTPCQGFETQRLTKKGQLVNVSISASRYEDHEGNPAGMLVILRDISDKKRLQVQLEHAQRMESIGTLAGGIAHDFNNLLMGIQGNVSLLLMKMDPTHPDFAKLENIERNIASGARLTGQLLGYARKGQYELQLLDLNRLIKESSETFCRTRREIAVQHRFEPELKSIQADRSQMEQVLFNLFINAADAMPRGGNLSITTRNVHRTDVEADTFEPVADTYVSVRVADTGEGMDPEILERIFDPFFTTKEMGRGTGLGLASTYGIVKAHGGHIEAQSQKGAGATFSLYFPVPEETPRREADPAGPGPRPRKGKGTVLLVDDENMILDVGAQMIEKLGFEVLTAPDGETAISVYQANAEKIELVILDMIMPEVGGGEVFDRLKRIDPQAKVLLSSGYSVDGQASEILHRGCNGFIQKPFSIASLSEKIEELTGGGETD